MSKLHWYVLTLLKCAKHRYQDTLWMTKKSSSQAFLFRDSESSCFSLSYWDGYDNLWFTIPFISELGKAICDAWPLDKNVNRANWGI